MTVNSLSTTPMMVDDTNDPVIVRPTIVKSRTMKNNFDVALLRNGFNMKYRGYNFADSTFSSDHQRAEWRTTNKASNPDVQHHKATHLIEVPSALLVFFKEKSPYPKPVYALDGSYKSLSANTMVKICVQGDDDTYTHEDARIRGVFWGRLTPTKQKDRLPAGYNQCKSTLWVQVEWPKEGGYTKDRKLYHINAIEEVISPTKNIQDNFPIPVRN